MEKERDTTRIYIKDFDVLFPGDEDNIIIDVGGKQLVFDKRKLVSKILRYNNIQSYRLKVELFDMKIIFEIIGLGEYIDRVNNQLIGFILYKIYIDDVDLDTIVDHIDSFIDKVEEELPVKISYDVPENESTVDSDFVIPETLTVYNFAKNDNYGFIELSSRLEDIVLPDMTVTSFGEKIIGTNIYYLKVEAPIPEYHILHDENGRILLIAVNDYSY